MEDCDLGKSLKAECHRTSFRKVKGFISVYELTKEQKRILENRTGLDLSNDSKICFHHKYAFLHSYENHQRKCCDPFRLHTSKIKNKALTVISLEIAENSIKKLGVPLTCGKKLCTKCMERTHKDLREAESRRTQAVSSDVPEAEIHTPQPEDSQAVNCTAPALRTSLDTHAPRSSVEVGITCMEAPVSLVDAAACSVGASSSSLEADTHSSSDLLSDPQRLTALALFAVPPVPSSSEDGRVSEPASSRAVPLAIEKPPYSPSDGRDFEPSIGVKQLRPRRVPKKSSLTTSLPTNNFLPSKRPPRGSRLPARKGKSRTSIGHDIKLFHAVSYDALKTFRCPFCESSFKSVTRLQRHVLCHAEEQLLSSQFRVRSKRGESHVVDSRQEEGKSTVTTVRPVKDPKAICSLCSKRCASSGGLRKHLLLHNRQPKGKNKAREYKRKNPAHECIWCGEKFAFLYEFISHQKEHLWQRSFPCIACNKRFRSASGLQRHLHYHADDKNVLSKFGQLSYSSVVGTIQFTGVRKKRTCQVCKATFVTLKELRTHRSGHDRESSEDSQIILTTNGQLQQNVTSHSGIHKFLDGVFQKNLDNPDSNFVVLDETRTIEEKPDVRDGESLVKPHALMKQNDSQSTGNEVTLFQSEAVLQHGVSGLPVKVEMLCDVETDPSSPTDKTCWATQANGMLLTSEGMTSYMQMPEEATQEWILPD